MKIAYLGSGAFGLPALEAVARSAHQFVGVVSQPDRPAGRGRHFEATPVSKWAAEHHLPLLRPEDVNAPENLAQIAAWKADIILVIAFGQKLSAGLLGLARYGGINLHASLLPKYRGAAPVNWALINNDAQTGVTVLRINDVMDGGEILATTVTPMGPTETAGELHDRLAQLGAPLVVHVLDGLAAGTAHGVPQDAALRSRAPKLSRALAWIDFAGPAAAVSARIRGLAPWPGCAVQVFDAAGRLRTQATILRCRIHDMQSIHEPAHLGAVLADRSVACGVGSIELLELQPAGKRAMDATAFANGYGLAPGARLVSIAKPSNE
jgi:methionyl-tRNA formyltransferase